MSEAVRRSASSGQPWPRTGRLDRHRAAGPRPRRFSDSSSSATRGAGTTRSIARSSTTPASGDVEDLAADVIPDGLGATADPAVPASPFDQGVDNFGPQPRAGRVAVSAGCGVAKHRSAEFRLDRARPRRRGSSARPECRRPRCRAGASRLRSASFCGIKPGLSTPCGSSIFFWA